MKTFKEVCRNNWYVIASTLLFLIPSEIFSGIISYGHIDDSYTVFDFWGNILLRWAFLIGGILLAYFSGGLLNHEGSGVLALFLTLWVVINRESSPSGETVFNILFVLALISLSFYYVNTCGKSLLHTIFYYIMMAVLALYSEGKIEIFIVLISAVFLFATKWMLVTSKPARIVNYICTALAVAVSGYLLADILDTHIGIILSEGVKFHPEKVILTSRPFGEAICFGEIAEAPYVYELTNVIGHFGNVAGKGMCAVIVLFVASLFVKCFNFPGYVKPADIVATTILSVKCIAGIFENYAIISGFDVRIPILADGKEGYLVFGLLLGYIFESRKNLDVMQGLWYKVFDIEKDKEEVPEDV